MSYENLERRLRIFILWWGKQMWITLRNEHIFHTGYTGCVLGFAFSSFPFRIPIRPSSILTDFFVVSFSLLKNIWKHVSHWSQAKSLPYPFKSVIHYNITQRYTKCGRLPFKCFSKTDFRNTKKSYEILIIIYITSFRTQYCWETGIINNAT
jgi:hypothetical protein